MNLHEAAVRNIRRLASVLAAIALSGLAVPASAFGPSAHASLELEAPHGMFSTSPVATDTVSQQWAVRAQDDRAASPRFEFPVPGGDSFADRAMGDRGGDLDYSGDHYRHGDGYWPEHGGIDAHPFDDGNFDDDHFCDGRCVPNPSVMPEPGIIALSLFGLAGVAILVRRRRRQGDSA